MTSLSYLQKKNQRRILGGVLAAASVLICGIFYSWQAGVFFALMFLAAGSLHIPSCRPWLSFGLNALFGVFCIVLSCAIPSAVYGQSRFFGLYWYKIAMNVVCAAVVYGLCLCLLGRIKGAVALASGLLMVMATVNYFVFLFRGHELKASDFFYVATAVNVMGQYKFVVPAPLAYCWMLWSWTVFFMGALPPVPRCFRPGWVRLGALGATVLCIFAFLFGAKPMHSNGWENEGTLYNGFYLNFALGLRDSFPQKPEDYSPEAVAELSKSYAGDLEPPEKKPNVVVILSESFADLRVLGGELRTNVPVTPFIDSLQENTIRGKALTSVFGGTTGNAEFEVLTGNSMALQPPQTVPYVQNIRSDIYSFPRLMTAMGYTAVSTHPFLASGYDRPRVYPLLGFQESTFDEAYPNASHVRQFISDRSAYDFILKQLDREDPLFLFAITMQNHGGYAYAGENYQKTISLEGYAGDYPQAEQYLSLLHETDRATEEFITALQDSPEDTVVLFFGDHLPDLEWGFYQELHGCEFVTLAEQMQRYTVPFFVWANFDIPEREVECTSLNYLANYALEAAGLPLPPYQKFLAEMEQMIPAVNILGYYSNQAETFLPLADAAGPEKLWLQRYAMAQYNGLFDKTNRSEVFFGQYLP